MQWGDCGYTIFQVIYVNEAQKCVCEICNSQFSVSPPVFSADRCSSVSQSGDQVSLAYDRARLTGASLHQRWFILSTQKNSRSHLLSSNSHYTLLQALTQSSGGWMDRKTIGILAIEGWIYACMFWKTRGGISMDEWMHVQMNGWMGGKTWGV